VTSLEALISGLDESASFGVMSGFTGLSVRWPVYPEVHKKVIEAHLNPQKRDQSEITEGPTTAALGFRSSPAPRWARAGK
jgi:hypothetical protein